MTSFKAADARASAAVDSYFGEQVRLIPWVREEYIAGRADPSRPEITLRAIFSATTANKGNPGGNKAGRGGDEAFRGDKMPNIDKSVTFDLSLFADQSQWPRRGDRIQRLGADGYPLFEVISPVPDGMNRLRCDLVSVG